MRKFLSFVCLMSATVGLAQADPEYVVCGDCSEREYRAAARAFSPAAADPDAYEVYVADVARASLRRFLVIVEREPGLDFKMVQQLEPAASELARFEAYIDARNAIIHELGIFNFSMEVPPGHFVGSAYDLWGNTRNQLLMGEFINAQLSGLEEAFSHLLLIGSFILGRSDTELFVKVEFPDGSIAVFELDGIREDLKWDYIKSESVDQDGNLIPDRLQDFDNYSGLFNSMSVEDFLLRAMLYGIPIVDKRTSGGRVAVVCVKSAKGGYQCVATPVT